MSALIIGTTGLVGSFIFKQLEKATAFTKITSITRREVKGGEKSESIVEKDTSKWPQIIESHPATTFFSSFGTTRATAGSADNFVKIDYGTNYDAAKAAKAAGVETFVLVSSTGANASSPFLYMKTKGKLEDDIIALEFPRTIILRPGALLGDREVEKDWKNKLAAGLGNMLYRSKLSFGLHPIKAEEVALVGVHLAEQPFTKSEKPQVQIVSPSELLNIAEKINV